jgi:hypothetical protein
MIWHQSNFYSSNLTYTDITSQKYLKQLKFRQLLQHPSSTVYCTLANRLVCRHDIDHATKNEHLNHNCSLTVVLAEHEIAPWWWFLREPKHVGATVGILIVLIFLWFYICVRQVGRIRRALILLMHGTNMKIDMWHCWGISNYSQTLLRQYSSCL